MIIIRYIRSLYLSPIFFFFFLGSIPLFVLSFLWKSFGLWIPYVYLSLLFGILIVEIVILYSKKEGINATRILDKLLSMGSVNPVSLEIVSNYPYKVFLKVIDELPFQFDKRDFLMKLKLEPKGKKSLIYKLIPKYRGIYEFGSINCYASVLLGLAERRYKLGTEYQAKVYPSIIDMKHYDLIVLSKINYYEGIKKIRKLGHSYEFEQIREYVRGDDYRSVNWKASSKTAKMMVNQYDDDKSQPFYFLIDNSRNMKSVFENLSLLDYSINTCLSIANVALKKSDKSGMISFAEDIGPLVKADNKPNQLRNILEQLYDIEQSDGEANFEKLFYYLNSTLSGRSILFIFTNFSSKESLMRNLPVIKKLQNRHLVILIYFKDSDLEEFSRSRIDNMCDVYEKATAEKFIFDKELLLRELKKFGIHSIYTKPENLSISVINKYLSLKSRGLV